MATFSTSAEVLPPGHPLVKRGQSKGLPLAFVLWSSLAIPGPMTSVAMRSASSLVIISRNLPLRGEVGGVRFVVHDVEPVPGPILTVEADDGRTARTKLSQSLPNSSHRRRLR
jgi:hypothetical protein